jgi:hypothetical protein
METYFFKWVIFSLFVVVGITGGCNMSQSNAGLSHYQWEWPADRKPHNRILVKINKLEKQGEGIFGVKNSPSIASNLPDAMVLEGIVVQSDTKMAEQSLVLTFPKIEIPDIAIGDKIALGIVENDVCICAEKLPASVEASQEAEWLSNWNCIK